MKSTKTIIVALNLLVLSLLACANAQWGYDPMMEQAQWNAHVDAYNQNMDAWVQQQMQQAQQQSDQAYANAKQFFIDYYRQHTSDYATPDQQAVQLGDQLYCQHNPVQCQQSIQHAQQMGKISAQGHTQRMEDIQSWGQTMQQIGQNGSDILDMSHQGYMNRQAASDAGQANYVQGAVYGESTFVDPYSGAGYSLPVYPDPSMSYSTPDGYPLSFDYATNTWYQGDGNGWWYPLNAQW